MQCIEQTRREWSTLVMLEYPVKLVEQILGKDAVRDGRLGIHDIRAKHTDSVKWSGGVRDPRFGLFRLMDTTERADEQEGLHEECGESIPIGVACIRSN